MTTFSELGSDWSGLIRGLRSDHFLTASQPQPRSDLLMGSAAGDTRSLHGSSLIRSASVAFSPLQPRWAGSRGNHVRQGRTEDFLIPCLP